MISPSPCGSTISAMHIDFDGLMHPGVGEHVAAMPAVRLAGQLVGGVDEVIDSARTLPQIGRFDLLDAMRNPSDDERLGAMVPQRAVDLVALGVDDAQRLLRRRRVDLHLERGTSRPGRRPCAVSLST